MIHFLELLSIYKPYTCKDSSCALALTLIKSSEVIVFGKINYINTHAFEDNVVSKFQSDHWYIRFHRWVISQVHDWRIPLYSLMLLTKMWQTVKAIGAERYVWLLRNFPGGHNRWKLKQLFKCKVVSKFQSNRPNTFLLFLILYASSFLCIKMF